MSWNCGAEGPTDDPQILELRERQKRNMMAMLFLSQGVPMLCGGDEMGRTQRGNNNAYCQDNELSWHHWKLDRPGRDMFAFVQRMINLRQEHPVLRRRRFFQGQRLHGSAVKDVSWFNPDGKEMTDEQWSQGFVRCLGMRLAGDAIEETDAKGRPIEGDTLLVLCNAHHEAMPFTMPAHKRGVRWERLFDTTHPQSEDKVSLFKGGMRYDLGPRSLALLRLRTHEANSRDRGPNDHAVD
jgi:glycogen operon protein